MIDAALVQQIAACYGSNRDDPAILSYLRDCFPQVRFTHCSDDEVGRAKPVLVRRLQPLSGGRRALPLPHQQFR